MPWSKANATCGVKGKPQGTPVSATEVLKFPDGQYVNKHVAKGKKGRGGRVDMEEIGKEDPIGKTYSIGKTWLQMDK